HHRHLHSFPTRRSSDLGKLLGQMIFDSVTYAVQPEEMLRPFIKEFGDGTVVDHAQIRKVQATKNDEPYYYAVGIGQKNGEFRMIDRKSTRLNSSHVKIS